MYHVGLSAADQEQLQTLQQGHIHPHIRRRALVILLRSENTPNNKITRITGLSENTITDYVQRYKEGGIAPLTDVGPDVWNKIKEK